MHNMVLFFLNLGRHAVIFATKCTHTTFLCIYPQTHSHTHIYAPLCNVYTVYTLQFCAYTRTLQFLIWLACGCWNKQHVVLPSGSPTMLGSPIERIAHHMLVICSASLCRVYQKPICYYSKNVLSRELLYQLPPGISPSFKQLKVGIV